MTMIYQFDVIDICLFIIFIISLIYYISVLVVIAKNLRNDNVTGTFFVFAFLLGVTDVISMLNTWLFIKFRQIGFAFQLYAYLDPFLAHFCFYLSWLLLYIQIAFTTIITLNRFTSIVFPFKNKIVSFIRL